jgi:hypothetical protein
LSGFKYIKQIKNRKLYKTHLLPVSLSAVVVLCPVSLSVVVVLCPVPTLLGTVTSNLAITSVQWQRNVGGSITTINSNTNTNKYSGSTTTTPSLTIFNAASSDVGTYTCFASNSVGTGQSTTTTLSDTGQSTTTALSDTGSKCVLYNFLFLICFIYLKPDNWYWS